MSELHDERLAAMLLGARPQLPPAAAQRVLAAVEAAYSRHAERRPAGVRPWYRPVPALLAGAAVALLALLSVGRWGDQGTQPGRIPPGGAAVRLPAVVAPNEQSATQRERPQQRTMPAGTAPARTVTLPTEPPKAMTKGTAVKRLGLHAGLPVAETGAVERVTTRLAGEEPGRSVAAGEEPAFGQRAAGRVSPTERLIGQLEDEDWYVRRVSAEGLGEGCDPSAVAPLIKALGDPQAEVRGAAVEALAAIGDARATPALIDMLYCPTSAGGATGEMNWQVLRALGRLGGPGALAPVARLLTDSDESVRVAAAEVLGRLGDAAAMGPLLGILKDPEPRVRSAAITALSRIGDPAAAAGLVSALADDPQVRAAATQALARVGGAQAVPALVELLGAGTGVDERLAVVRALGAIGEPTAGNALQALLHEADAGLRAEAQEALARIAVGSARAARQGGVAAGIAAAATALQQGDDTQQRVAVEYLVEAGAPAGSALMAALASGNPEVRYRAAVALGELGDARAADTLLEALASTSQGVQLQAARALGSLREARAVPALVRLLAGRDGQAAEAAAEALGRIGGQDVVLPLQGALASDDQGVVERAARALGRAAGEEALEPLARLLSSTDSSKRLSAVFALGESGGPQAVPYLVRGLADDGANDFVRTAAARALARWGWHPVGREQSLRYLVATGRYEEAAEAAGVVRGASGREATGPVQAGIPLPTRVAGRLGEREIVTVRWLEFRESEGHLRCSVFFTEVSWPPSTWRLQVELLDGRGAVTGKAEAQVKNSGLIISRPMISSEKLELGLGAAAGAARFRLTVDHLP